MSTTDVSTDSPTDTPKPGTIAMKLEVIAVPVSDVDRAKAFYASLGWRLDADFELGEDVRVIQFTPTQSDCSLAFGKGFIKGEPGSVERLEIVVSDIEAAREDLISRGVEVSDFFHRGESGFEPGLDPGAQLLQQPTPPSAIRTGTASSSRRSPSGLRPGLGGLTMEVAQLADLLHETAEHHDAFEKASPPHDWWDWYAAYLNARLDGSDSEAATATADRYMAEVKGVVASR